MKTYIINLESDKSRKVFMQKQLDYLQLDYNFFKASTPEDIKEFYYNVKSSWQRPLKETEVACLYSHYRAWQEAIKINEPILVLEDDVLVSNKLKVILDSCYNFKNIDYINLESTGRKKYINLKNEINIVKSNYKMYKMYIDRSGAGGYIIYPSGAKKLVNKFESDKIAITDAFIKEFNLKMFQVYPIAIIQQCQTYIYNFETPFNIESNIYTKQKVNYSSKFSFIKFKIKRVVAQINQGVKIVKCLLVSTKILIPMIKDDFSHFDKWK